MAGIYVHIPFCSSRCAYCGFFSTTRLFERQRYVDAVCREMDLRPLCEGRADTVYVGGGTPSQLTPRQLEQLFAYINNVYDVNPDAEVTIECNPDDVTPSLAALLRRLPVNRVSMGVQTFDDARLQFLRRRHTSLQAREAVRLLREAGIANISIDLIYAFPGESLAQWHDDVLQALLLDVEHISAYALSYEEGSLLERMLREGRVDEADEELQRQMYYDLKDLLETAGYEHYEISNFARQGFRSRHNSSYWNHTPYIGLGAGAHSFDGRRRQWNVAHLDQYIQTIGEGRVPAEGEDIDVVTYYNETVMTALRTCEGIDLSALTDGQRQSCLGQAQRYMEGGLLAIKGNRLVLTREGLFVSDMVMSDLMAL